MNETDAEDALINLGYTKHQAIMLIAEEREDARKRRAREILDELR